VEEYVGAYGTGPVTGVELVVEGDDGLRAV